MGIEVKNLGGRKGEVLIYEQIGASFFADGVTAKAFAEQIKALGPLDAIDVRINSPGGSVPEGLAIYNTLKNHGAKVTCHVDGIAASIASVIAMAGETRMASNSLMMIHNPAYALRGDAAALRKAADMLDKVRDQIAATYAEKSGRPAADFTSLMNDETWLTAEEAVAEKLCDGVGPAVETDARVFAAITNLQTKLPEPIRARYESAVLLAGETSPVKEPETMSTAATAAGSASKPERKAATIKDLRAKFKNADAEFLMAQVEAEATMDEALAAWNAVLENRLAERDNQIEALKGPNAGKGKPSAAAGAKAVKNGPAKNGKAKNEDDDDDDDEKEDEEEEEDEDCEDVVQKFQARIGKVIRAKKVSYMMACRIVAKQDPDLHRRFILATNQRNGRNAQAKINDLIDARFEENDLVKAGEFRKAKK